MFHSIVVDNGENNTSELTLSFIYNGQEVAVLRVACDTDRGVIKQDVDLPFYIKTIENIACITDKKEIDSETPIQVYCGNDKTLSPILLLEETEYDIEIEKKDNRVTNQLSYVLGHKSIILKVNHFGRSSNKQIYNLYSKSYVGKGYFDITVEGTEIKIPFEVRSKKIEYLDEYPKMLSDIADFSVPLLLDSKSPLFRNYSLEYKKRETFYEDFVLLDFIYKKMRIEDNYNEIKQKPYVELISSIIESKGGNVSYVDSSELCSLVTGNGLFEYENGVVLGKYSISDIKEINYIDSYNNQENKLVKDLLLTMQLIIYSLSNSSLKDSSDYITNSIHEMKDFIDCALADEWLSDIDQLDRIPFESTVLQSRHGYSELFQIYQLLGTSLAFNQEDIPDLLEGHNKKVYDVYEYWCYTRLYRCLYDMSINKPLLKYKKIENNRTITIRNGKPIIFDIKKKGILFKVCLYYNKEFDQKYNEFRSYSIRLRPDYTLVVKKGGISHIINFDAKYKVKPKDTKFIEIDDSKIDNGCWEYDIYKMHTYRDALMKSLGSYVLYPGPDAEKSEWKSYIKPRINDIWENRDSKILPSVGAISLTPGVKKDQQLIFAINKIFDKILLLFEGGEVEIN